MPVVFGTANTVTGSGSWTYPDVGLVIGLLIDVNTVSRETVTFGSEIMRYRGAGVFAPISEAGRLHAWPLYNDQLVTYDIGHGPTGVAYDLPSGTEITITEILSETPPTGGGGTGVDPGAGSLFMYGPMSLGAGGWLQPTWDFNQSWSPWSWTSTGGLTLPLAGLYQFTCTGHFTAGTTPPTSIELGIFLGSGFEGPFWSQAWAGSLTDEDLTWDGMMLKSHGLWSAGDTINVGFFNTGGSSVSIQNLDYTVSYVSSGTG